MEYRLFLIGIVMGAYAWASRRWERDGGPRTAAVSALWRGAFFFLAGFSATLIVAMSYETRARFLYLGGRAVPVGDVYPSLAVALVAGVLGFWRGWSNGGSIDGRRGALREDQEWADTVFSAALMASLLMMFVVQAFKIPSASMQRTLLIGDRLFVNKFLYGLRVPLTGRRLLPLRPPRRGDVIVFQFPTDAPDDRHCGAIQYGKDFIKRLVAVPGETVEVRAGRVLVDGRPLDDASYAVYDDPYREPASPRAKELSAQEYQRLWEEHRLDDALQNNQRDFFGPVTVPPRSYFMMGDNRDHSCDSRYWGPVEERFMKGKAWFLYWPPSRMGPVR